MNSVYDELVIHLIENCRVNAFEARKVVNYLRGEGLLDYDGLKEYFDQDEENS